MNRHLFLFILFPLCITAGVPAVADAPHSYYFRSFEVEDGLSQNMVYTIIQDRQGFMWFGTQDGLNRFDGRNFKIFKRNGDEGATIGSNGIFSMAEDDRGMLWIGTADGVYIYDPTLEVFTKYSVGDAGCPEVSGIVRDIKITQGGNVWLAVNESGLYRIAGTGTGTGAPAGQVAFYPVCERFREVNINLRRIEACGDEEIWIATYGAGLLRLDGTTGAVRQFLPPGKAPDINEVVQLSGDALLLGTVNDGVMLFNRSAEQFQPFLEKDSNGARLFVRRILRNTNGELWIGTEQGIYVYNMLRKEYDLIRHAYNDPYSISDNAIHSMFQDREGGIWIGTFFGGVNYFTESLSRFEKYYPLPGRNSVSGKSISEFAEDRNRRIWIGTEDAGLNMFDPATGIFSAGYVPVTNIHALCVDGNRLWVGSFSNGLFTVDIPTGKAYPYSDSDNPPGSINNVYSIYKDYSGEIWIGTMTGLHRRMADKKVFEAVEAGRISSQVNDIKTDHQGTMWFATIGDGLFSYKKYENKWCHYQTLIPGNVSGKMVTCLLEDQRQRLWAGTEGGGLMLYDRDADQFTVACNTSGGLPNDVVYQIVEDSRGCIWGSTNKGLFCFDPRTSEVKVYTHADGLPGEQFNYKSGFRTSDGRIYFGGIKGFVSFTPDNMYTGEIFPLVVINSLQVNNREVAPNEKGSPLKVSVTLTDRIELPYGTPVFSLGFSALSYLSPSGNRYAYKLEGWDKEWITDSGADRASYSNLPAGEYIFKVRSANGNHEWDPGATTLAITILPPFYLTGWAYIFYIVAGLATIYLIVRYYIRKTEKAGERMREIMEREKEKELNNAKFEFFTNVTHEIRTPLSLIKSPLDEVMKHIGKDDPNWENLSITQRNADRMLHLVNELLDFKKAESKVLGITPAKTDMGVFMESIITRFKPSAKVKGLRLETVFPQEPVFADIDAEIMTKVVSNLLNNALKHAGSFIRVSLAQDDRMIRITVTNDGPPIPAKYRTEIFEPLFKIDNTTQGTGLGLPFARSLVELHHGSIELEDTTEYICFTVTLPLRQEHTIGIVHRGSDFEVPGKKRQDPASAVLEIEKEISSKEKKTILLTEDNRDFQTFLSGQLASLYNILNASNGQDALEMLAANSVDLVISDLMMPLMDGMELCSFIKQNIRFSHIPVIMLTAKTGLQHKIEGLRTGADEYIEKPYSIDYLKVKIENLLLNRQKIIQSYTESPEIAYDSIVHSKADSDFLEKLIGIIDANIEKTDLDVDWLAAELHMSRATFYRKVKGISSLTPNDFIRLIRLKKAAELLREKQYRVNEIAFIVGFGSPSYFSKCFFKQFGVLPKDYVKPKGPADI